MRTRPEFLRRGVAQGLLNTILREAEHRGYQYVYLETGTGPAFDAAHSLYLRNGFAWCDSFGDYRATDFNAFMRKAVYDRSNT
jgi:putative acetyltransferase